MKVSMPLDLKHFIRYVRLSRNLTQAELAKELKYGSSGARFISKIEQGCYKFPVDFLSRLSPKLSDKEAEHLHEILSDFRKFKRTK